MKDRLPSFRPRSDQQEVIEVTMDNYICDIKENMKYRYIKGIRYLRIN